MNRTIAWRHIIHYLNTKKLSGKQAAYLYFNCPRIEVFPIRRDKRSPLTEDEFKRLKKLLKRIS